jgi:hypothetical protein
VSGHNLGAMLSDVTAQALSTAVPLDVPGTELDQLIAFLYYF